MRYVHHHWMQIMKKKELELFNSLGEYYSISLQLSCI